MSPMAPILEVDELESLGPHEVGASVTMMVITVYV